MIPEKDRQILRDEVEKYDEIYRSEYRVSDPDVHVFLRPLDKEIFQVFTKESMYQTMEMNIDRLARNAGGSSHRDYDCLEWAYEPESELRELFIDVYRELFHKEAKGVPVHTGLECGIIAKNIGRKVDMISIGSEIKESHKPGEWFSISSAERYWKLLLEVLNRL